MKAKFKVGQVAMITRPSGKGNLIKIAKRGRYFVRGSVFNWSQHGVGYPDNELRHLNCEEIANVHKAHS